MKDITVDNNTLFFAFRYALGRMSSAPGIVMTNIIKNKEILNDIDLKRYIKEIDECDDLGMDIDKRSWLRFRDELQRELDYRKTLPPKVKL